MELTKEQIISLLCNIGKQENGLQDILAGLLESMMRAERREFLSRTPGDKANGYRPGRTYGHGRELAFRIPRDRMGQFKPVILACLRDQEERCQSLAAALYTEGLTTRQVGRVFEAVYGAGYSKASISRMLDDVRGEVAAWRSRPLEAHYRLLMVDCVHIKVHRDDHVATEAFYVALAVTEEGRREVLGLYSLPTESASGWRIMFGDLKSRGVRSIGLAVADGLRGMDAVVGELFPGTPLLLCVVHLLRDLMARVCRKDRAALAADAKRVFRAGEPGRTLRDAWRDWQDFCGRWQEKHRSFKAMAMGGTYMSYMTFLRYSPDTQHFVRTTNWIERLNRDFRRVTRMRTAMPSPEAVFTLLGSVAMDHPAFDRVLPAIAAEPLLASSAPGRFS